MKLRAYIVALHAALFAILLAVSPAGSGSMTLLGAGVTAAAGGSPTIGGGAAAANGACTFSTTCNTTTTGTVTTGMVTAIGGVKNSSGSSGTITGISVCGTALNVDFAPTIASGKYGIAIGHGSVTGAVGSCTISVTFSVANAIEGAGAGWITLNSLASSTPDTSCQAFYDVAQNSPYPCTGGLTITGSGFGIVGYFDNQATTPTNGGSITVDATAANSGGISIEVAIGHVTATCTAAQCQYAGTNFGVSSVIGESFH
jgi:hypothetical protein